jgi:hypothetical protein
VPVVSEFATLSATSAVAALPLMSIEYVPAPTSTGCIVPFAILDDVIAPSDTVSTPALLIVASPLIVKS